MDTVVHRAAFADAPAIARTHLATHREAYAEAIGLDLIEQYSLEIREGIWTNSLERGISEIWVAERDGEIVGFSSSGPPRDDPPVRPLELWTLYLLQSEHGSGAGQALLDAAISDRPASLWVLGQNPRARRFYERNGFVLDGTEKRDPRWKALDLRMVR